MIVRGARPADNFAQIHNAALSDGRLSFKARGILAYLLSRPPGWKTSRERLAQSGLDGERSIRSGLKELEELGYLTRTKTHAPDGTWVHDQVVTDQPTTKVTTGTKQPSGEEPSPEEATTGALCTGGYGSDINNTSLNNTYLSSAVVGDSVNSPTDDSPQPHHGELVPPRDAGGWRPSAAALKTADQTINLMDIELSIAKYRVRVAEMKKEPTSSEWLRWLIKDEQEALLEAKKQTREGQKNDSWFKVAD